jgi:hypothetical protein
VPAEEAVKMMLAAARQELKVRDFQYNQSLRTILAKISLLVSFEVQMDQVGLSLGQVFAPYTPGGGLRLVLIEEANKIESDDRHWVDPFHDFEEASREVVLHYRDVAEKVTFNGVMLQRWIVGSALDCADVHMALLQHPPPGTEDHLDTVAARLTWFLHVPAYYFKESSSFPYGHAEYAAERLTTIGIRLLRLDRPQVAKDCAEAIASIGSKSAEVTNANAYSVADIFEKLEVLARAAEALGHGWLANLARALERREEIVGKVGRYEGAIENRTRYLDELLAEDPRRDPLKLRDDPVVLLRQVLREAEHQPGGEAG